MLPLCQLREGNNLVPKVNVPIIKPAATRTTTKTDSIETDPTRAIDCKDEIKITAITSSTIKIPKTRIEDSLLILPISSNIFTITAVLEIERAAEMNNESIKFNPSAVARIKYNSQCRN